KSAETGLGPSGPPGVVTASPDSAKELALPSGVKPIDLAASASTPEAAILVADAAGKASVVAWKAGDDHTSVVAKLPPGFIARAIASHPARRALFVSGTAAAQSQILALTNDGLMWRSAVIFETPREIGRLIVGPRPFKT